MRQTCPVKSLTLVVLGWDWVPFLPWNPAKMLLRLGNVHFYYVYYHFSVPWPNSLEQTAAWKLPLHPRVNFQKQSRKSREKWEIFHCRTCTKSITTHKIFGTYIERCACSQAKFPAYKLENGQQNGKFFTVASALLFFFFQTLPPRPPKTHRLPCWISVPDPGHSGLGRPSL